MAEQSQPFHQLYLDVADNTIFQANASQAAIARHMGMTKPMVTYYLTGARFPSNIHRFTEAILEVCQVDPDSEHAAVLRHLGGWMALENKGYPPDEVASFTGGMQNEQEMRERAERVLLGLRRSLPGK